MIYYDKLFLLNKDKKEICIKHDNKHTKYINLPFAFDIETTNYIDDDGNKRAFMYIWQAAINGVFVYGRTWTEFKNLLNMLKNHFELNEDKRLVFYVHNLSFEFHFLQGHFPISDVFAREKHKPMKCIVDGCFEFRCSQILAGGLSLEKVAKSLTIVKINKKVGDLDYNVYRDKNTILTSTELDYCEYDVKILHYYILQFLQKYTIANIPLTQTSFVRQYCRNYIRKNVDKGDYSNYIKQCFPTLDVYTLLHKCFMGGYTHANYINTDVELHGVSSLDFTSQYPTQMVMHKFPMSKFVKVSVESDDNFDYYINNNACIFEICIQRVKAKTCNHTLSLSKCIIEDKTKLKIDNGRIIESDNLITYMTDIDFKTFKLFYDWESFEVDNFYISNYGYLPKSLIECVLTFYEKKTTLKDVEGVADEYMQFKQMLNGIYGMCVTNILNPDIIYNFDKEIENQWSEKFTEEPQKILEKLKNNRNTFLLYQHGVFVTAWARYELLKTVYKVGEDVVYCDTDSIKLLHYAKHKKIFDKQNKDIINNITKCLKFYDIPLEKMSPKNNKGKVKQLGVWDYEGEYYKFKTLGAKRYVYSWCDDYAKSFAITIAGLGKINGRDYMVKNSTNPFEFFNDDLKIDKEKTGKLTHLYGGEFTDFRNGIEIHEYGYVYLEPAPFKLKISEEFLALIYGETNDLHPILKINPAYV